MNEIVTVVQYKVFNVNDLAIHSTSTVLHTAEWSSSSSVGRLSFRTENLDLVADKKKGRKGVIFSNDILFKGGPPRNHL